MQKPFFILVLLVAITSCHEPRSREQFIGGEGPYVFTVDMSRPDVSYCFDLYSRVDKLGGASELELCMCWKTPEDSLFRETVYLPLSKASFFSLQAYTPYRAHVVPSVPGVWTLTVTAPHPPKGLRGVGLVVKKD